MKAMRLSTKFMKAKPLNLNFANFTDKFRDKELAEEKFYFDKEERKLAQKLLNKLKKETKQPTDVESQAARERLGRVLERHNEKFSPALIDDILKWKMEHH